MGALAEILVVCVAVVLGIIILVNIVGPVFRSIGWVFKQIFRFIGGEVTDIARLIGAVVTSVLYVPMVMLNLLIGRWSACSHYGRALQGEVGNAGLSIYRVLVGHPLRLIGLGGALEGVEKRMPAVVQAAPGADAPPARAGKFEGYKIIGSLPGGGSGAKLYVAEPDAIKQASFARDGVVDVSQVVIKSFSLKDGSSLPQIVRESRSLDAAKKLRLILDHELASDRFYYVMRYVPGDSLSLVSHKLHASSPASGLGESQLRAAIGYVADLVGTLSVYHRGGLWHKDVKPDNIIIDARDGRANLVDFGLVSSLRSAMTLTTHGTEYFRDSEMVRLALKGVKVHEVDGTKFDIYGAGAVLYSVLEDSFPAHGVLSQFSKNSPEAVRWIVRRAMTDYDKRYPSAEHMLADLRTVMACADPFALKPFELPSMRDEAPPASGAPAVGPVESVVAAAASVVAAAGAALGGAAAAPRGTPAFRKPGSVRLKNWWTGEFEMDGAPAQQAAPSPRPATPGDWVEDAKRWAQKASAAVASEADQGARRSAQEQLKSAHARLASAQERVQQRIARTSGRAGSREKPFRAGLNPGIFIAIVAFAGAVMLIRANSLRLREATSDGVGMPMPVPPVPPVRPDQPARPGIDGELDDGTSTLAQRPREILDVRFVGNVDVSPAVAPTETAGRVLVVNDVLQPWSDEFTSAFGGATDMLKSTGIEVVGLDGDVDVVAKARLAVGQSAIDTDGAAQTLTQWLRENRGAADALVWFAPPPAVREGQPAAKPRVYVFNLDPADMEDGEATRVRDILAAVKWSLLAE